LTPAKDRRLLDNTNPHPQSLSPRERKGEGHAKGMAKTMPFWYDKGMYEITMFAFVRPSVRVL